MSSVLFKITRFLYQFVSPSFRQQINQDDALESSARVWMQQFLKPTATYIYKDISIIIKVIYQYVLVICRVCLVFRKKGRFSCPDQIAWLTL